jgi:hypothetical protein
MDRRKIQCAVAEQEVLHSLHITRGENQGNHAKQQTRIYLPRLRRLPSTATNHHDGNAPITSVNPQPINFTRIFHIQKLLSLLHIFIMGNICGKSEPDHFAQPGRILSSAPPPSNTKTSSIPKKVGGPPRTLGSNASTANAGGSAQQEDAGRKAAKAAEVSWRCT